MKILVIMKRFGANKDMVLENFGRQIRLFEKLADRHKIDFLCPDHVKKESKIIKMDGMDFFVIPFSLFSIRKFFKAVGKIIKNGKYDAIIASTEPLIGILGHYYSKKYKIPFVYDLQDNFETYDTYKLPFVSYFDKKAVKEADAVITVSNSLKEYISRIRKIRKDNIYVIENGIDLRLFKEIDRSIARKKLRLPLKSKIIVYVGHLEKIKGAEILLKSFEKIREKYPDACLLISGKVDKSVDINKKNIIYRKLPKRQDVVSAINAADVAVLPNPSNDFTKYCFPYKIVEYMACNVPIVATAVGDVSLLLKKYEGSLCKPDDCKDLAEKVILKLKESKKIDYSNELKKLRWDVLANKLELILGSVK